MIITTTHHGKIVYGQENTVDKYHEHCLCYQCRKYNPGVAERNCRIAQTLFEFDKLTGVTTPVFYCQSFECAHEVVETTFGHINPIDGYDDIVDALVCIRCGKSFKTLEEQEDAEFTELP